jgi:enoyl-CoA hydratase
MADELSRVCDLLDEDSAIGAVVLRGDGDSFCAGAQLTTLTYVADDPADEERYEAIGRMYAAFARVARLQAPTIAAVRGAAVGAGLNLALSTDLRILADDARLISGFLRRGLHPGGGHLTLLHRLAGREVTAAMALFGEEIDGRRAVAERIAWASVPSDQVDDKALELARRAAHDPALTRFATRSLRAETQSPLALEMAIDYERAPQMWSLRRIKGSDARGR